MSLLVTMETNSGVTTSTIKSTNPVTSEEGEHTDITTSLPATTKNTSVVISSTVESTNPVTSEEGEHTDITTSQPVTMKNTSVGTPSTVESTNPVTSEEGEHTDITTSQPVTMKNTSVVTPSTVESTNPVTSEEGEHTDITTSQPVTMKNTSVVTPSTVESTNLVTSEEREHTDITTSLPVTMKNTSGVTPSAVESTDPVTSAEGEHTDITTSLPVTKKNTSGSENCLYELLEKIQMKHLLTSKLTLRDILSIGLEDVKDKQPIAVENLPWNCLRKLMALNQTARDGLVLEEHCVTDNDDDFSLFSTLSIEGENNSSSSIHPLDVLCALLHCSDSFLQQEIITKMSMCQFAVPLLLPAGDGPQCTFMLWAMRDIVKKWRPQTLADSKGFSEENVENISMPIFSFARMGENKLSKSTTLNKILNPAQVHNDFFIHNSMKGGNITRKISDGLVEMSWYFPSGKSDVFPEPIAVANLRGDLASHLDQFSFLTRVSSAVFIFIEDISEREFTLLSNLSVKGTQYYIILTPGPSKKLSTETLKHLDDLSPVLQLKKSNVIMRSSGANEASFVGKLKSSIASSLLNKDTKRIKIREFESKTHQLNIHIDEQGHDCRKAKEHACNITKEIKNVAEYKQKSMVLQGDLWKQLSEIEKELCRMTKQEDKNAQQYLEELKKKHKSLHEKQNKHNLPNGITLFIDAITKFTETEKHFFLKWMKIELDSIARNNLSKLHADYKEKCSNKSLKADELKLIDQKISDSSLGIEHFLREIGQFYEAECSMIKEKTLSEKTAKFTRLPGLAADLMLEGFPLELMDGDASNIPILWIKDILTQLNIKTGNKCRLRVITVLGVQSTGKSTLLNTMFGLQFPVASGRCTRGAFMTLLKVKENSQKEMGCDFIMVIDTEGLKAPELASLEGSYEHDNELATLVVGLSDVTIVNMAMENTTEMKDILQIVVHAFLRMKEVGKRPNCQFVHQNVSDVSAYDKNMRDRNKLLEQLDEITKIAAAMEKKNDIKKFCDVMDYNLEKDNWYIPGLWLGVPPMAPVNSGYSEQVDELKKYLLEFMKNKSLQMQRASTIPEFIEWIESLWKAVKHEKFIFSFRNSLVAEAYNNLSMAYSQWEWEFRKAVHEWLVRTETNIKNQTAESMIEAQLQSEYKKELSSLLTEEQRKMLESLDNYFKIKTENVHLVERYKQDFILSLKFLRKELEQNAVSKCDEALSIQKGKFKVLQMQNSSQSLLEKKITDLLKRCREKNEKLSDEELKKEFENMWTNSLTNLRMEKLQRRIVRDSMHQELIKNMSSRGSAVNETLVNSLEGVPQFSLGMDENKRNGWVKQIKAFLANAIGLSNDESQDKIKDFLVSLTAKCDIYVREKVRTGEDYHDNYCMELLHMIDTEISQKQNLNLSSQFELEIKHYILVKASREFQGMHDTFISKNDSKLQLDGLKAGYLQTFISSFQKKDMCQSKAKQFCEQCLKPAMTDYVFKHLGNRIVDDIKDGSDNKRFCSRTYFQSFLLKELIEELSFPKYVEYIGSYDSYTRSWIQNYIENKYKDLQSLEPLVKSILTALNNQVLDVVKNDACLTAPSVSDFLKCVCEKLKNELVISSNEMKVVFFQNTAPVNQFSSDVQLFLKEQTQSQILSEIKSKNIEFVLSKLKVDPRDELFRQVVGCGKVCPFCKVPCEGGGFQHQDHFATLHRPDGMGRYRWTEDRTLCTDICSTSVVSNARFKNSDTKGQYHPFNDYRAIYPHWDIKPDPNLESSDYWKYIFVTFNEDFAKEYNAKPAKLPDGWKTITKEQALHSIKTAFNES
ncbi:interferon-induced very large GTPase 1-like isoform X2 [Hyperolius riggenbachi]